MYSSRIPRITAELAARIDQLTRDAADTVVKGARDRAPVDSGDLKDAIRVEQEADSKYSVTAGDRKAFYGHMVEFGTVRTSPRPFLVPALEASREDIIRAARARLEGL